MTEAEQAAADVMRTECVTEGVITTADPESFDRTARAVVAAVRGPMFAELAARVEAGIAAAAEDRAMEIAAVSLETAAADWENQPESVSMKPDVEGWLHRRAAALRTTTPEETR